MYVFNQINISMATSKNLSFDGKNIILIDQEKNYSTHSVEEILSNRLNHWKNWSCSIGQNSLYIDYDGNIYKGVCRQDGALANIDSLDRDITITDWAKCQFNFCTCGADMAVPKIKDQTTIVDFFEGGKVKEFALGEKIARANSNMVISTNNPDVLTITWAVGRRCNFDCWYCPDTDHNNYEEHKSYDQLMSVIDKLEKFWIKGRRVKFSLLGGELTVYKDYLTFVKKLKELGHMSITTTNGSRNPEYYRELAAVSDVCFSIHLNYVKELGIDKFLSSVENALEGRGSNWVSVRIMTDPGNLDLAKTVYQKFKNSFGDRCPINVKPVHPAPNLPLFKYDLNEIIWIRTPS